MAISDTSCIELQHILQKRNLQPLFQPIISLSDAKVIGFEALIRGPSDSPLHSPLQLFKTALACKALEQLEMLCRELSIQAFANAGIAGKLFLNVNPLLLLTADHPSGLTKTMLQQAGLDPARVVIEISEQYQVEDATLLVKAVHHYRELGFLIAIDDLGSGFSGLKLWSELEPDIVKIDRYFISDVHRDPTKKAFVQNIIRLAKATGALIVAEGIETQEELMMCRELGADLAQGYLLGRPQIGFKAVHAKHWFASSLPTLAGQDHIEQLVQAVPTVPLNMLASDVFELFRSTPSLHSMAVINQKIPLGLICRDELQALFAQPYGRALHAKKTVGQIMNKNVVMVEADSSLDDVSQIVAEDDHHTGSWFFIICRKGEYLGLGSVRQLLKKVSEHKLQHARYANPLTFLPGNVPIYREIDRLLNQKADFAVAYLDLNHFKPFNDIYGYSKGDTVLQLLAEIIQQQAAACECFIGHIGGDDFVVISPSEQIESLCQHILDMFAAKIPAYYAYDDVQKGGITALSRTGDTCFYPLLSLAIGIALPDAKHCHSHHDVAALSTAAKFEAKRLGGNALFVSRRRGPDSHHSTPLARPSVA
ncbi:GGDEF domain-containing protein [Alishewanella tabrizica]|uniref:D-glycero-D-manno-heptose 1-phosphate guanosyltransferase n=1 Tax=Alishewanella tabrizica TaxID=671278 RepID=A0ABQ2WSA8_9ALTE|nr:GGDEF domain-containing protein [Alishewanella tabrizica]GGW68214.1 D-glycero-D-manno-heptose 1-phosphate guanosyltransferase [Alishewanella tabrizica]